MLARLHLRARFRDPGPEAGDQMFWVCISSKQGMCSIGVSPQVPAYFALWQGFGNPPVATQGLRRKGWRVLELILQGGKCFAYVDSVFVLKVSVSGTAFDEQVSIGTSGQVKDESSQAVWAGIELMHTPFGDGSWDSGSMRVLPGRWKPWLLSKSETGKYELYSNHAMGPYHPKPARAPSTDVFQVERPEEVKAKVLEIFRTFDSDGDGMIDVMGLSAILRSLDGPSWTDARLSMLFKAMDNDRDSQISYEDFLEFVFTEDGADVQDAVRQVVSGEKTLMPHVEADGDDLRQLDAIEKSAVAKRKSPPVGQVRAVRGGYKMAN